MENIAFAKDVLENHKGASVVTNGQLTGYTGKSGFCQFAWPDFLTVDLDDTYSIKCIRFLLWDGLGINRGHRDPRQYKYRLLVSEDSRNWTVLYSTEDQGFNGWQVFNIPEGINIRFIRVHGLWNSANKWFHVVEIQAFVSDSEPLNAETVTERVIRINESLVEVDEYLPIQRNFQSLIVKLEKVIEENPVLNPQPIQDIIQKLGVQVRGIAAIENNIESIKKHIKDPVYNELEKASNLGRLSVKLGKFSYWGFIVGIVGGIVAIISIILSFFK